MIKIYDVYDVSEQVRTWKGAVPRSHAYDELVFVVSGKGKYTVWDKEYMVAEGDVLLFLQNTVMKLAWIAPSEKLHMIRVRFAPEDLINRSEHDLYLYLVKAFYQSGAEVRIPKGSETATLLHAMARELLAMDAAHTDISLTVPYVLSAAVVILANSYSQKASAGTTGIGHLKNYDAVLAAVRKINLHYREDLNLDMLAKTAGMSKNSFLSHFKRYFGVTPYHYILVKRMEAATRMLTENKHTVTEIAYACGFHSTAAFNRQFLLLTGKTPTEMKRELTKK